MVSHFSQLDATTEATVYPAECRHACHFASSRGESEMESWTMNSGLSEKT